MTAALRLTHTHDAAPRPSRPLRPTGWDCEPETDDLRALRQAARSARCARRLLAIDAIPADRDPAPFETLVRALPPLIGRRPVFHLPGSAVRSFDEAWLMRCLDARAVCDRDSLAMLTGRLIADDRRRAFHDWLARAAAELADGPGRSTPRQAGVPAAAL